MGNCTSLPGSQSLWDQYFDRSLNAGLNELPALAASFRGGRVAGLGLVPDHSALQALSADLQAAFSAENAALAKTLFRAYDMDKDGFLSPSDIASLLRDIGDLLMTQGNAYIDSFISRAYLKALPLIEAAAAEAPPSPLPAPGSGAADAPASDPAAAAATVLRARLDVVEEEARAQLSSQLSEMTQNTISLASSLIVSVNAAAAAAAPNGAGSSSAASQAGTGGFSGGSRLSQPAFIPHFLPCLARALEGEWSTLAPETVPIASLAASAAAGGAESAAAAAAAGIPLPEFEAPGVGTGSGVGAGMGVSAGPSSGGLSSGMGSGQGMRVRSGSMSVAKPPAAATPRAAQCVDVASTTVT